MLVTQQVFISKEEYNWVENTPYAMAMHSKYPEITRYFAQQVEGHQQIVLETISALPKS